MALGTCTNGVCSRRLARARDRRSSATSRSSAGRADVDDGPRPPTRGSCIRVHGRARASTRPPSHARVMRPHPHPHPPHVTTTPSSTPSPSSATWASPRGSTSRPSIPIIPCTCHAMCTWNMHQHTNAHAHGPRACTSTSTTSRARPLHCPWATSASSGVDPGRGMTSAVSTFSILSPRGDTIISREYRDDTGASGIVRPLRLDARIDSRAPRPR